MPTPVYVAKSSIISAAGTGLDANWQALQSGRSCFMWHEQHWQGVLPPSAEERLSCLRHTKLFHKADRVALLAAAAVADLELPQKLHDMPIIAASARGATTLLEREHARFLRRGSTAVTASPHSTAGMLASLLARYTHSTGASFTLSATCVSGMQALGTALALIRSGSNQQALCVASEAPLTPFTVQMLKQARVLSNAVQGTNFPMRPLHPERTGLVLAEGAAAVQLSCTPSATGIRLAGYGAALDYGVSLTGVATDGRSLSLAITRALQDADICTTEIDLIIGHGASTLQGDEAEWQCLTKIFAPCPPPVRFHKWCIGHTLGSSTMLSTVLACHQLQSGESFSLPYLSPEAPSPLRVNPSTPLRHVLVCGLGFGGNCAALVLSKAS